MLRLCVFLCVFANSRNFAVWQYESSKWISVSASAACSNETQRGFFFSNSPSGQVLQEKPGVCVHNRTRPARAAPLTHSWDAKSRSHVIGRGLETHDPPTTRPPVPPGLSVRAEREVEWSGVGWGGVGLGGLSHFHGEGIHLMIREDCETLKLKCAETKQVRFWLRRWSRFQQHVRLFWDASRINPSVKPFLKMSEQFFFFL